MRLFISFAFFLIFFQYAFFACGGGRHEEFVLAQANKQVSCTLAFLGDDGRTTIYVDDGDVEKSRYALNEKDKEPKRESIFPNARYRQGSNNASPFASLLPFLLRYSINSLGRWPFSHFF